MKFKRNVLTLIHRMYKIVVVLFKLTTVDYQEEESIFDKLYCLQAFLQAISQSKYEKYLKTSQKEVEQMLEEIAKHGGTKGMSVKEISRISSALKDRMNIELADVLGKFKVEADFFLNN